MNWMVGSKTRGAPARASFMMQELPVFQLINDKLGFLPLIIKNLNNNNLLTLLFSDIKNRLCKILAKTKEISKEINTFAQHSKEMVFVECHLKQSPLTPSECSVCILPVSLESMHE